MATVAEKQSVESQIRQIIEDRKEAVRNKNADVLVAQFSEDAVLFDVTDPLQTIGTNAIKKRLQDWFDAYQDDLKLEIRDLTVATSGDIAFCHFLNLSQGTLKNGSRSEMWVRFTVCLQNKNGRWLISHEHASDPFNPETGKTSLDLKP